MSGGAGRALPISVEAARALRGAGDGLVVVLLREQQVVGTLHWRAGAITAVTGLAASIHADQAVLIVVGSVRVAGRLMLEADESQKALAAAGIDVTASIHIPALDDHQRWIDLAAVNPRDGIIGRVFGHRR